MKQIRRLGYLLTLVLFLMLPKAVLAASCVATTLDQYMVSGFSCAVGDLEFSNFSFSSFPNAGTSGGFANNGSPNSIQVSPQSTAGQAGLAFTNMGLFAFSTTQPYSTSEQISFTVTALSGLITGDSVAMTDYSTSSHGSGSSGSVYASLSGTAPATPIVFCSNCSSPPSLTDSQTFAGITSALMTANASVGASTFASPESPFASASLNGVTTLFTLSPSAVPIPAAVWLFGSGLLGLVGFARRKKV